MLTIFKILNAKHAGRIQQEVSLLVIYTSEEATGWML
jgi:hypothetical protein